MMHVMASLNDTGWHKAAWRAVDRAAWPIGRRFQTMARTAERGRLDAVLLGEAVGDRGQRESGRVCGLRVDALPLLGSLIPGTARIGLAAGWPIDFTEPYNVARVFATLDHLAGGRTAWLARMFEDDEAAGRFGHAPERPQGETYCARAEEFIDLVRKLWDSWEDEGFLLDVPSGRFADPARVHPVEHAGPFFTVRGPLNVPRPPQGNPVVIVTDPGTPQGRMLAARMADVVLVARPTAMDARDLYRQFQALAVAQGRPPDSLRIIAAITTVIAASEPQARARATALDALLPAEITAADGRAGMKFVGTPAQLVDQMEAWMGQGCCDGFNIRPAVLPLDLDAFVDAVVPLAQARGLMRVDYAGADLRTHLGLARPLSRYAA